MIRDLIFYYQNCRGTRTKLHTLYMNILSNNYDVIILTETWLVPWISDNEFIDQRYVVFRCDRDRDATTKLDGGGVVIAVLRSLRPAGFTLPTTVSTTKFMEHVLVELPSRDRTKRHLISAVYIPPKSHNDDFDSLQQLVNNSNTHENFYIFGDYNLQDAAWTSGPNGMICNGTSTKFQILNNFLSMVNAKQYNYLQNHVAGILDLLISNSDCTVLKLSGSLLPVDNYHPPFIATVPLKTNCTSLNHRPVTKYNYFKADYKLINEDLDKVEWDTLLSKFTAEEAVEYFYEKIYGIVKKHTPLTLSKSSRFPTWFPPSLIHIFKNKARAWSKWKVYGNISDYEIFSLYRKRFRHECDKAYTKYKTSVEDSIPKNVKYFWSYVSNRKGKPDIPSNMRFKDVVSNDPEEICNLFSTFFQSVYEPSTLSVDNWTPPFNYAEL